MLFAHTLPLLVQKLFSVPPTIREAHPLGSFLFGSDGLYHTNPGPVKSPPYRNTSSAVCAHNVAIALCKQSKACSIAEYVVINISDEIIVYRRRLAVTEVSKSSADKIETNQCYKHCRSHMSAKQNCL